MDTNTHTKIALSDERLKSILLNHFFPNHDVAAMIPFTHIVWVEGKPTVVIPDVVLKGAAPR
jgi:hypothetical protein